MPSVPNDLSRSIRSWPAGSPRCASSVSRTPVDGIEPDDQLVRLGRAPVVEAQAGRPLEDQPELGLRHGEALAGADEERHARPAPVVDLEPHRRVGLRRGVGRDAGDLAVAVVLAADVVGGVGRRHRVVDGDEGVLDRVGIARRGRLGRRGADDLHQVVDDDVAERADRVVEVASVVDAELLGHRDLHARHVVAVPDGLEDRVGEAQEEDLGDAELPEVVVDAVELALVEVLVHLRGQRARRLEVVAEGLLDHDARVRGEARAGQALDHGAEEERRDLEVEDGAAGVLEPPGEPLERLGVAEVARHVGQAGGEALEHRGVERLARREDRLAGALLEVVDRPVVDRDADDRAVQEAARLEPVERMEGHHLGEVAGDAEDDEDVGGLVVRRAGHAGGRARDWGGHAPILRDHMRDPSSLRGERPWRAPPRPDGMTPRGGGGASIAR